MRTAVSILGIELRRSAALGAALLVLVVGVVALYVAPGRWSSGWLSLALSMREYTIFLWPIALAAGAWQGRREHQSRVGELFSATPRSRARRMLPLLGATALAIGSAYVLVTAVGGTTFVAPFHYLPPGFFGITAAGALSLAGAAWLGLGLGRLLPAAVTAPVLAVLGVLLVVFGAFVRPFWLAAVLSPMYGSLQFYAYQTIDGRVSVAFSMWMAGLALTGAVLLIAERRWLVAAVLPALVGLGLAVVIVPRAEAVTEAPIDPSAAALVCTDDAPKVCVSRVTRGVLEELTPLAREGLAILSRLPGTPAEVHEDIRQYGSGEGPSETGVVLLAVTVDKRGHLAHPASVVPRIVGSLGVTRRGSCDNRNSAVERAAAYYLLGRPPVSDVGVMPGVTGEGPELNRLAVRLWQGLRQLPEKEALARIAEVRQAVAECEDSSELLRPPAR
ncbi:hypothetical protein [Actinoplanes solisilvae]|uniref:hypothetical protein n=1 Tax=Actinoplanes solisilvae TaxID=2486853 RepID=UPI001F0B7B8A|nr:hypothetical protein [Actinoplanes solisilvae]